MKFNNLPLQKKISIITTLTLRLKQKLKESKSKEAQVGSVQSFATNHHQNQDIIKILIKRNYIPSDNPSRLFRGAKELPLLPGGTAI